MEYREEIWRLFTEEGFSQRRIAQHLRVPHSTVNYWIRREGRRAKRGRPRVTDGTTDTRMVDESLGNPFTPAVDLRTDLRLDCSVSTVRRRLKEGGLRCRVPARKQSLKASHIEKRQQFAFNHLEWEADDWSRVVFSDEKIFRAAVRGPLHVYRPARGSDRYDARYIVPSTNPYHTNKVMAWVAFSGNGVVRTIQRVEGNMNGLNYTENILPVIENALLQHNLIFMHDQSPIHMSTVARNYIAARRLPIMTDWPPKGADMNPVENVWGEMVRRMRRMSRNLEDLWETVRSTFYELEPAYFAKLSDGMKKRMEAVRDHNGGWTKY